MGHTGGDVGKTSIKQWVEREEKKVGSEKAKKQRKTQKRVL